MRGKKFTRAYPETWSIQKIADFMADCRRAGNIPKHATATSKKRGDMIVVTWTWKDKP